MNIHRFVYIYIVHFLKSLTGGGIYGNCSAMGHVGA